MNHESSASQMFNLKNLAEQAIPILMRYGFQIVAALGILIISWFISDKIGKVVTRFCESKKIDVTLSRFIGGVVKMLILFFAVLIALAKLQIEITPFVAALTASVFGLTLAIQGPIANYGAGLAIILTRPFVVGNTITIKGVSGVIEVINLPCTKLRSEDGEVITIPNKQVVGEIVVNSFGLKVVEQTFGLSYLDDPVLAIAALREVLNLDPEVGKEQVAQVGIDSFGDSGIMIGVRYWVPTTKYHETRYRVNLAVHQAFKKTKLTMPFPQRDVHMHSS